MQDEMYKVMPVLDPDGSDSARLDNCLEFLVLNGIPLPMAVMITIPEPWETDRAMSQEKKDFYQYYATMMELGMALLLYYLQTVSSWEQSLTEMDLDHRDTI